MIRATVVVAVLGLASLGWLALRGPTVVSRSYTLEWQTGRVDDGAISFFEDGALHFVRSRPSERLAIQGPSRWMPVDDAFSFTAYRRDGARRWLIAERQLRLEAFSVVSSDDDGEHFTEHVVPLPVTRAAVTSLEVEGRKLTVVFDLPCEAPVAEWTWRVLPKGDPLSPCSVRSRDGGRTWRLVR